MTMTQLRLAGRRRGRRHREIHHAELKEGMGGRTPVFFNTFGWDVGLITAAAVAGSDGSRQGIRDALEKLHDLPALNGPVSYSAGGPYRPGLPLHHRGAAGERGHGPGPADLRAWTARLFLQLLLPGATTGCVYALVALGFVLCANVSGVVNFAQGEFVMLGGMAAAWLVGLDVPLGLAILAACADRCRRRRGCRRW